MIYLASDHRGMVRKEEIKKFLDEMKEEYQDCGNLMMDPQDDEVDFVNKAGEHLEADFDQGKRDSKGIFFCGSDVMVDVAANKFPNVRSCLAFDRKQVEMARNDDDANVLSIAANFFDLEETTAFVKTFLKTSFSNEGRFLRRIEKLKK
jgi:ribose 5-phosphate isomerase B